MNNIWKTMKKSIQILAFAVICLLVALTLSVTIYKYIDKNHYPSLNKVGNSAGNLVNGGLVCRQGNWIYYGNDADNDFLYKIKLDGSSKSRIIKDEATLINVIGDWIYYTKPYKGGLYKVKTDGRQATKISNEDVTSLSVSGEWLYYTDLYFKMFKMKTDGSQRAAINNDQSGDINVTNDWIYYINSSDNNKIYKIRKDGTDRTKVNSDICAHVVVAGGKIYYSDFKDKIYKMNVDGSKKVKICDDYTENNDHQLSEYINVSNGWIYYTNKADLDKIYKVKTDGRRKTRVSDESAITINIVGDWIYYFNTKISKIKTNGKAYQDVN